LPTVGGCSPVQVSIARMRSIASQQRQPNESNEEKLPKRSKANEQQERREDSSGRAKSRKEKEYGTTMNAGRGKSREPECEAYKRISIIVDVIIIFHFQSKRYAAPPPTPSSCARNIKNRRELNELFIYLRETHKPRREKRFLLLLFI